MSDESSNTAAESGRSRKNQWGLLKSRTIQRRSTSNALPLNTFHMTSGSNIERKDSLPGQTQSGHALRTRRSWDSLLNLTSKKPLNRLRLQRSVSSLYANHLPPMDLNTRDSRNKAKYVRLKNHEDGSDTADTLHKKSSLATECASDGCQGSVIANKDRVRQQHKLKPHENLLSEAEDFITQYYEYKQLANTDEHLHRWDAVKSSIDRKGTYTLEKDELAFGAKTAWRNASRCIGRIQWNNLEVLDARDCQTAEEMFEHICHHLEVATNGGNIRSTVTVFKERVGTPDTDFRIWNHQLIRYAGYTELDGSVTGDPAEVEFTKVCQNLGWKGDGGRFDVLPLVLQARGEDPKLFEIPKHLVMEVQLKHPKHKWFQALGLKWYAVPAITSIMLDVGGIQFPAAPFNGWYMQSEIARNFCEPSRYNMLKVIAHKLGLDTKSNYSLWKDEAFVEFNKALLYSYKEDGVTIIDHHSASDAFMSHLSNEQKARRGCPADWVWVVPPIGGSLCKVWHQEMLNYHLRPSYEYMSDAWTTHVWKDLNMSLKFRLARTRSLFSFRSCAIVVMFVVHMGQKSGKYRPSTLVLYATETGKSERYAKQACSVFQKSFKTRVMCMEDYDATNLLNEELVLIVASTFGNGDPPTNGMSFYAHIQELLDNGKRLPDTKYGIFALGSSAYPHFCKFGKNVDKILSKLEAVSISEIGTGDELCGEADTFREWLSQVLQAASIQFGVPIASEKDENDSSVPEDDLWSPEKYVLVEVEREVESHKAGLSLLHRQDIIEAEFLSKSNLHGGGNMARGMTMFIRLQIGDEDTSYEPGDHVALFPQNDPLMVNSILERVDVDINVDQPIAIETRTFNFNRESIQFQSIDRTFRNGLLPACSLRTALTCYLDITSPPTPRFLKCLAQMATNSSEEFKLKVLAKGENAYLKWRLIKHPSLVDILSEFRSLILNPSLLMTQLPLLQPRLYSISSSQALCQQEIHLTVSLINYRVHGSTRPARTGVASSWLSAIHQGTKVPIYVKPAPDFHLPVDITVPSIYIATGSGIAPFRSFWQELVKKLTDKQEKLMLQICGDVYDTTLLYGCRTMDRYLYKDEIEEARSIGALKETRVVYSREPDLKKTYVQHILEENGEHYTEKIVNQKAHIYVCGAVQLAEDVQNTIIKILKKHRGFTTEKAETYIEVMKKTHRYHEDVFGVLDSKANFVDESGDRRTITRRSSTCDIL